MCACMDRESSVSENIWPEQCAAMRDRRVISCGLTILPFGKCERFLATFFGIAGTISEMLHCTFTACVKRHSRTANVLGGRLSITGGRVVGQSRMRERSAKTGRA